MWTRGVEPQRPTPDCAVPSTVAHRYGGAKTRRRDGPDTLYTRNSGVVDPTPLFLLAVLGPPLALAGLGGGGVAHGAHLMVGAKAVARVAALTTVLLSLHGDLSFTLYGVMCSFIKV